MSTPTSIDEALALSNRHFMYTLLGRLFGDDPTAGLVDLLHDEHVAEQGAFASSLGDDVAEAVAAFQEEVPPATPEGCEQLQAAYTRLFVDPSSLPAPPWESVYVNSEPLLFQKSTLEVRRAYREAGYLPAAYPHVADDHLAIELNFMAALAGSSVALLEGDDAGSGSADAEALLRTQAAFLDEHLLRWTEAFAERLAERESGGLYPAAARLTAAFCASDRRTLEELLARLKDA